MVGLRVAQLDLWHAGRTGGRCTWGGELPAWSSSVRGRQWQHRTQLRRGCPLPLRAKKSACVYAEGVGVRRHVPHLMNSCRCHVRRAAHYEALGLEEDATPAEIKRAFRRAARTLHPDVNPSTDAEAQFMAVLEAYQALSDPNARSAYDVRVGTVRLWRPPPCTLTTGGHRTGAASGRGRALPWGPWVQSSPRRACALHHLDNHDSSQANARANDPRFARFERWRRTIIPRACSRHRLCASAPTARHRARVWGRCAAPTTALQKGRRDAGHASREGRPRRQRR